jgi:hypothetical protein
MVVGVRRRHVRLLFSLCGGDDDGTSLIFESAVTHHSREEKAIILFLNLDPLKG